MGHKIHLNKFKRIGNMHSLLSPHWIKQEISNRKIAGKFQSIRILNNSVQNNTWIEEKISEEIKNFFELNGNKNLTYQNLCDAVKTMLRREIL